MFLMRNMLHRGKKLPWDCLHLLSISLRSSLLRLRVMDRNEFHCCHYRYYIVSNNFMIIYASATLSSTSFPPLQNVFYFSTSPFLFISTCLFVFLYVCLSGCLSGCLSICASVSLCGCVSAYLSTCLSICLSISLSPWLWTYPSPLLSSRTFSISFVMHPIH